MTAAGKPAPGLAFWRTVQKIDKLKINNGWMALRNAIAVAVPLAIGIATGNAVGAAAVATGALNVSFSDGRDPYYQRARRMLTWTLMGALASFLGCAAGGNNVAAVVIAAIWAFGAGLLMALGPNAGDLGLNTLVALVVFAGRGPMSPISALNTALLVLSGGLLQSAFCLAFWPARRYLPERRAVGHAYLDLAREVSADIQDASFTPLRTQGPDEEATIAALGDDHTVDGERFRLLFDQADRLRLSLYLLARLRDELGEEDNQESEDEGAAADLLDTVKQLTAQLLRTAADRLVLGPSPGAFADLAARLRELSEQAQGYREPARFPLAANIAGALDVLFGQLRLVVDLVENTGRSETAEPGGRPNAPASHIRFAGWRATLLANLDLRSAICRHAIRLSVCLAAGDFLERSMGWQRAYWLPMTIAVVLKPDFASTFSRGVLRLLGTFGGLVLASALFHLLPVSSITQLLLVGLFTFLLRYLGPANYGLFTLAISGLVVFLIAATGVSPAEVVAARAFNTGVGGLVALIAYIVWPTWERTQVGDSFADMIEATRLYLQSVFEQLIHSAEPPAAEALERRRLEWRRARSNVEASVDRVMQEPGITAAKRDNLISMLASSGSLAYAVMGLEAGMSGNRAQTAPAALKAFAHDLDFTLYFIASALRGSKPASQSLPELRADHRRLTDARSAFWPNGDFVLKETDRLTVSLNTLREQVLRYVDS